MKDSNHTIFQSAKNFLSGTLVSRFSGLLRDISMAFAFGTAPSVAALMIAFRFAHLFRRLLGEGTLQMAFVPQFESLRKKDSKRALTFFCDLTAFVSLILFVIIVLSVAGILTIYFQSHLTPQAKEPFLLTAILMPSLFFICLYGLNSSLLQCERSYFIPSISPVAFNLIWILGALFFAQTSPEKAMPYLALFIIVACIGQWLITVPHTLKILRKENVSYSFSIKKAIQSLDLIKLFKPLLLGMAGVAATQVNNALDPIFARFSDSEGPAFLWYAIRLQQFPIGLFAVSISSALLPPLSRAIKSGEIEQYKSFLDSSCRKCLLLLTPMMFAYFIAGDSCVNLLFGHGDFQSHSITVTTKCLWAYSIGLIPTSLTLIFASGFYALSNYRTPTIFSAASVIVNIFLNTFFVFSLKMGSPSVALATSISSWVNFLSLFILMRQEIGSFLSKNTIITIYQTFFCCLIASFIVFTIDMIFYSGNLAFAFFQGKEILLPTKFYRQIGKFLIEAISFAIPILILWKKKLKN